MRSLIDEKRRVHKSTFASLVSPVASAIATMSKSCELAIFRFRCSKSIAGSKDHFFSTSVWSHFWKLSQPQYFKCSNFIFFQWFVVNVPHFNTQCVNNFFPNHRWKSKMVTQCGNLAEKKNFVNSRNVIFIILYIKYSRYFHSWSVFVESRGRNENSSDAGWARRYCKKKSTHTLYILY